MKYSFILLVAIVFGFLSCNQASKESSTTESIPAGGDITKIDSTASKGTVSPSKEEPANSIFYEGTLPCTDCEGIKTELAMGSNFRYFLSETHIGKDGEVKSKGYYNQQQAFAGDGNATLVVLSDSKTGSQKFFMRFKDKENDLILLDNKKKVLGGGSTFKLMKR